MMFVSLILEISSHLILDDVVEYLSRKVPGIAGSEKSYEMCVPLYYSII